VRHGLELGHCDGQRQFVDAGGTYRFVQVALHHRQLLAQQQQFQILLRVGEPSNSHARQHRREKMADQKPDHGLNVLTYD
jgi:hypothetical protein